MVTRPYLDLPLAGLPLLALRLAIVGFLVELSYRYIELPVRRGAQPWHWLGKVRFRSAPASAHGSFKNLYAIVLLCLLIAGVLLLSLPAQSNTLARTNPQLAAPVATSASAVRPLTAMTTATAVPATVWTNEPEVVVVGPASRKDSAPTPLAVTPTPFPAVPQPLDPALIAALQTLLDDTVSDGFIPGASLSVSLPGYLPWSGASGMADPTRDVPMEVDTLAHIASITKMFTSVVVLQLVEEGKLDLDAPVSIWLPDVVRLADVTTVRQLLSHTSGIYDYLEDPQFYLQAYGNPDRNWTPAELVLMADQFGPAFKPGAEGMWKYSSTNYVILGMLVEQVTGRTLAEEMRQRIFDPLKLRHTFFAPDEAFQGTLAQGYIDASDQADVSMTFVFGTGNLISTASDLRRFAEALFDGQLLPAESLALMTAAVDTGGAYAMPELQYGLGLMQARLNVGAGPHGAQRPDEISTVLGHIGGIAGFRSAVWWVPESKIAIALSLNQADIDLNLLARDALDVILAWQGRQARQ